jgi:hypothetical protein
MLDQKYGMAIQPEPDPRRPNGFDRWEQLPPRSLSMLTPETAKHLEGFMNSVEVAWNVGSLFMARTTILWIVDLEGNIRFAIEEYVDGDNTTEVSNSMYQDVPYHKTTSPYKPVLPKSTKLGHPSLVSCGEARIGGEILFDSTPEDAVKRWYINAQSGRYGVWVTRADRRIEHLQAVQYDFLGHKIVLRIDNGGFKLK